MARGKRQAIVALPYRQTSGLFLKGGQYFADVRTDDGRRFRRRFGADRTRALKLFDELRDEIEHGGENPLLADFLTERFLPTQERLKSFAFTAGRVNAVVRFVEATEPTLRLRDIRPFHVERMRAHFAGQSPRTLNGNTQKLAQALNLAVDMGVLDVNPLARVKPLTVDNRRTRFLTMDDFVRILDAARNTDARDLFLTVGLTGLRPSNVRLLTVGEVDIEARTLRIPPEKMKGGRWGIVPVSRLVADLLAERIESVGGQESDAPACALADRLLFPARARTGRVKSRDNLSRAYRAVVRRLDGLGWSSLYDLRHFFASQLAKQGANESQIRRLLCHVGSSVTARYVHHDIDDLRRFVEELSERYLAATGQVEATRLAEARDEATVV